MAATDLAAYLRQKLPEDEAFARKLALALESEAGAQQVTVVAGGQVDQIVNIARLGVLNLTVKRHVSVFRDVRQLVVFLAVALAVGTVLSFIVWKGRQPAKMTGDFNIAVAEFGQVAENAEMMTSIGLPTSATLCSISWTVSTAPPGWAWMFRWRIRTCPWLEKRRMREI